MAYVKYTDYKPTRVSIGDSEYAYTQGISGIEYEEGPVIDPILENNSWAVIKQVCQDGQAENYWALGDEKIVTVGEYEMAHAIVDFTPERYVYHDDVEKSTNVVFQSVKSFLPLESFNPSSNVSPNGDTAYNGWFYSNLRAKLQSGGEIFAMYDEELSSLLEAVDTYQAYSGLTNELHTQGDLLFLPAVYEVFGTPTDGWAQSCESSISEFGFYAQNSDADANRIKLGIADNTASRWWLRSSRAELGANVLQTFGDGSLNNNLSHSSGALAPCFAW